MYLTWGFFIMISEDVIEGIKHVQGGRSMSSAFIAVDIGASSGRLIVGWLESGQLKMEEVHRFKNAMTTNGEHFYWDIDGLFSEIVVGLGKASELGKALKSIGVDTWGVDYVLVDDEGNRVAPVYAYRDHRTDATMDKVFDIVGKDNLYAKTGIQFMQFNTLFQIYEHMKSSADDLEKASSIMLVPDYLHFKLSGVVSNEYTNASTSQMLNVAARDWDEELIAMTGAKASLFQKPIEPGTILGDIKEDVANEAGVDTIKVIAPATHDTGSAVVSVPALESDFAYISSGTWSLMGIESDVPLTEGKAAEYNFTNEGGALGTYRVLKNLSGLWLIQEVARMYDGKYSFAEFVVMAEETPSCGSLIRPEDERFLNPDNMIEAIKDYCKETGQAVPETPGAIARTIFESLACLYRSTIEEIREISEQPINRIHIIGGGCQNKMLNRLCADYTECEVYAGPIEATAIGNLMMQMIAIGEVNDLKEARKIIHESFGIETYAPSMDAAVQAHYETFKNLGKQLI